MTDTPVQNEPTQRRQSFLTLGYRPFFLLGALWAAGAMALWVSMVAGWFTLPSRFDPVSWHAHAFLFGYLGSIIAGFLLTAVPNWTGRPPLVGGPLLALVLLWCAGRIAIALSELLPLTPVIFVDLSFPFILGALILREVIAGKNWRNIIVVVMLAVFTLANLVFHLEAARGDYAAKGYGLRLGLAAALMMISIIGGRIIPTFTGNWLKNNALNVQPVSPLQPFDKAVLLATLIALSAWLCWPYEMVTGASFIAISGLHAARLARWKGIHTKAEPLVWVLHVGYACVPIGAFTLGLSILLPTFSGPAAAQHIWMAGAIGLMTLAVMTRATLGHTGCDLHAGRGTVLIYAALIASVAARLSAGLWDHQSTAVYALSGTLWIIAFAGFAAVYGALLIRPKPVDN